VNGKQLAHQENVLTRWGRAFRHKYAKGQQEHGGNVWEKPAMLSQAKAEVLDLICYVDVIDEQLQYLALGLRSGAITPQAAADQIDRMRD